MSKKITKPEAIRILKSFVPFSQLNVMASNAGWVVGQPSEEKQFFIDKLTEFANRFINMHKTYEQDGKGDEAIVHLHYFAGGCDWYITEKDMEDEQHQAFGLADLGYGGSLGYISLVELTAIATVNLDLDFIPCTMGELKARRAS